MSERPNDRLKPAGAGMGAPKVGATTRFRIPDKEMHLMSAEQEPGPVGGGCSCNAVCTCVPVRTCSCDTVCTCDSVCTCQGVCSCNPQCTCESVCSCNKQCSCDSQGHYWYPN